MYSGYKSRTHKSINVNESTFDNMKKTGVTFTDYNDEDPKRITQEIIKGNAKVIKNSSIINQDELERIKKACIVMIKEEELYQKKILDEQKEKQQATAKAKKDKMLKIEEEKKKLIPESIADKENDLKKAAITNRAQTMINEEIDEVKHMNQMVLHAKVVTIRDKQLEEKKDLIEQHKLEEKRKDLMMEIDRLKKIKYYEELDKAKKQEIKHEHLIIVDQIKERELARLKQQEEKEREGEELIRAIKQIQKEESENGIKRKHRQKQILDEIAEANKKAVKSKEIRYQQEKDEEQKIFEYNVEKAQKEAEYLAEQKRIKDEKEREVQRLREMQEKVNDRQSELDALRAKRAQEMAERLAREKERKEAEKRAKMNKELYEVRQLQTLEKEVKLQEQAKQDRDEFQKIVRTQKEYIDYELKLEQERNERIKQHAEELKKQIILNEEKKKQNKRNDLEEGRRIKEDLKSQHQILQEIKTMKLGLLKQSDISEKYQYDLTNLKLVQQNKPKKRVNIAFVVRDNISFVVSLSLVL